jgi:hypothetical protein
MKQLKGVLAEVNHHLAAVTSLAVTGDGGVEGVYAVPHLVCTRVFITVFL